MLFPKPFILKSQHHEKGDGDAHQEMKKIMGGDEYDRLDAPEEAKDERSKPSQISPSYNDSDGEDAARNTSAFFKQRYSALQAEDKHHDFSEIFIH